jgi:predicted outer membrane repeat protein
MSRPEGGARRALAAVAGAVVAVVAALAVLAAPSGATVYTNVTTEAGFRTAWTDSAATEIDLGADIVLAGGGGCTGVAIRPNTATSSVTLNGNGHTITQMCPSNGVLQQNGTGALTFQNVTITGGTPPTANGGGAIETGAADITLTNSTFSGNTAAGQGGGIRESSGNVTLTNSTISGNTALEGGGIREAGGNVTLTNSTISGNTARDDGGGIRESTGAVTVTNSTISGNTATFGDGGGIRESTGAVTLVYATVVQNSAVDGANIWGDPIAMSSLRSFGSVVALAQGVGTNCTGVTTTSNGFNFQDDAAIASCGFAAATDKQNAGDPKLGALASNGGSTLTRLPQSGSPLIDAIPFGSCQAGITIDQRAFARPSPPGGSCDIGAVEVQVAAPAPASAPVVITPKFTG